MLTQFLKDLFDRLTWPIRRVVSAPMTLFSAPRLKFGFSLPVRLAVFAFLFLLICVIVGYCLFHFGPNRTERESVWDFKQFLVVSVLLIVIPLLVHRLTWMWLDGETSRYPDIDAAWKAGLKALKDQGQDLCDLPLFLVMGPADARQAQAMMQASGRNFSISGVPDAAAPLHWFCDSEAAFLVLTGTTRVAALATLTPNVTIASPGRPAPASPAKGLFTATAELPSDSMIVESDMAPAPAPSAPAPAGRHNMTLQADNDQWNELSPTGSVNRAGQIERIAALPDARARDIDVRLGHVLHLIRAARQPYCPINGVLSALPFHLILAGDAQSVELQKAVRADLDLVQSTLQLRCPVSVLVGGMETESGFRVLARRIGREKVKSSRFGKGNDSLWTPATPDNIEAISRNACGAFEDWVYHLFSAADGLTRTDNGKLYSILCLVRTQLQERLTNLLCGAYGRDNEEAMLFSGCYFGATGDQEDRQAFVKGVFDKLAEQEEQLSWMPEALDENERYTRMARIANTLNLGLIVLLVLMGLSIPLGYRDNLQQLIPWARGTGSPSEQP
ncbi:MAG: hypothetical protein KF774_18555 [Planctomyces sp.]|nr:hypothetical protein [Planctomyces sp.]